MKSYSSFFLRILVISLLALAYSSPALRAAVATDFQAAIVTKIAGEESDLPYRFLVPTISYDPARAYPLIVFLHGIGEIGTDNTAQLGNGANGALKLVSTANQTEFPSFMLAPQSPRKEWEDPILDQVVRAIQQLSETYPIDPNRIYVTGLSMGGFGTWRIATRYPSLFAAAVPMSAGNSTDADRLVNLPLWVFHAVNDRDVPIGGTDNAVGRVRRAGGRVIYTRYATGGHGIWQTSYGNPYLLPWMMAQRRNQPVTGVPILSITSPSAEILPPPGVASMSVSGVASIPGGVSQVHWTTSPSIGNGGIDTSSYTLAEGTENWSVVNVPRSSIFFAVATGPTLGSSSVGGGATTVNDSFWKVNTSADTAAPTLTILDPSSTGEYTTGEPSLNLRGSASAGGTKTIQAITWRNDRGGQGSGVGTTDWFVNAIDLFPGDNVITITARDSSSITATATLIVHTTFGPTNTPPLLSTIGDQVTTEDNPLVSVAFTVDDRETDPARLTLRATSSDETIVPNSNLTFSGSGRNRSLSIVPVRGHRGTTTITITAFDGELSGRTSFVLTVRAASGPNLTLEVDFGLASRTTPGNVNNITNLTSGTVVGAVATNGVTTRIQIAVTDGFQGINQSGVNSSDLFPSTAQSDSFFVQTTGDALGVVTISNLDPAKFYDLSLFSSREGAADRTTTFTVGGIAQSINAANNTNQLVTFAGLRSTAAGVLEVEVRPGGPSPLGYLNALRLIERSGP